MTTPPKPKVKWTLSMAFFVVFIATFCSLIVTGLAWFILWAFSYGIEVGTIGTFGLVCVVSFLLWLIAENVKGR
jgi:hypothetical protein